MEDRPRASPTSPPGAAATVAEVTTPDEVVVPVPGWVRTTLWFGLGAVALYVAGWLLGGALRSGYDPVEQAISELFELGAPWVSRGPLVAGLVVSGVAFLLLAPALHRVLPGGGLLGPALVVVAGIGTLGVALAPCSPGCPGSGTTATDTWHAVTAGGGYAALVLAPLAFAWRVRAGAPRLAGWSLVIGGASLVLFVVYLLGAVGPAPGLQQRTFNTLADGWYVLVVVWILRRDAVARRS